MRKFLFVTLKNGLVYFCEGAAKIRDGELARKKHVWLRKAREVSAMPTDGTSALCLAEVNTCELWAGADIEVKESDITMRMIVDE